MNSNPKKICLVVSSLGKGGAQRVAAMQSEMLSELGHDVHIVTVFPDIFYHYKGTLFNLGLYKSDNNSILNRIKRLLKFRNYLKNQKFDVIIDHRSRVQWYREFLITKFLYNKPTVYVIHSYEKSIMFTKYDRLNKYLYKDQIMVGVSETISEYYKNYFQLNRVYSITNAIDFNDLNINSNEIIDDEILNKPYVMYYGRLDNHSKNLNLLLEAYHKSKLIKENIKLLILGSGPDEVELKKRANDLGIQNSVTFKPQLKNPFPYVKASIFTVLTSAFEGFPLVLLESLSIGTPVVSVDCNSGPDEIITHKYNGLLVENFNAEALANAMNSYIFDQELYDFCKSNVVDSVQKYSTNEIAKKWQTLINSIE